MTSLRQIEANRRNAEKSTGPRTEAGKQRSALNAVRHGLTAETVVLPMEAPEDYQAFEEVVLSGFDPETAAERELVLRVAALLWRLRRAISIETGLLQLAGNAEPTAASNHDSGPPTTLRFFQQPPQPGPTSNAASIPVNLVRSDDAATAMARRFLNLPDGHGVLERTTRYEMALWRQLRQTLLVLDLAARRQALRQTYRRSRWSHNLPGSSRDERR
jgi:hypothetical protein